MTFVDPVGRRAYASCDTGDYLAEYDLDGPGVPGLRRVGALRQYSGFGNPNLVAVDSARRRAYLINLATLATLPRLSVLDLDSLKLVPSMQWELAAAIPGFDPAGITYSPLDDRIYLVGMLSPPSADAAVTLLASKPAQAVTTAAIDAKSLEGTQRSPIWVRSVPQCQMLMDNRYTRSFVFHSGDHLKPSLLIPCIRMKSNPPSSAVALAMPGQHAGVARLHLKREANQLDAVQFESEFFPISGVYNISSRNPLAPTTTEVTGMAAFDPTSQRFFLQSQSAESPGVWVFDGKLSSWVGFIRASGSGNEGLGLDSSSGHVFALEHSGGHMRVSNGRATPIQQGTLFNDFQVGIRRLIATDPLTHRVFVLDNANRKVRVLLDQTPSSDPGSPTDYDSQTQDVAEGPHTYSSYLASSSGFGARTLLVGGCQGINYSLGFDSTMRPACLSGFPSPVPNQNLRPGDRGGIPASSANAGLYGSSLRRQKANGEAQALVPDYFNTSQEWGPLLGSKIDKNSWPWPAVACEDTQDDDESEYQLEPQSSPGPTEPERTAAKALVECDLSSDRSSASSVFGATTVGAGTGQISIGSSSFGTQVFREFQGKIVTKSVAETTRIRVSSGSHGEVYIGRVVAEADTWAHGAPGSAEAIWRRSILDVTVKDAEGAEVVRGASCTTLIQGSRADQPEESQGCRELVAAIEQVLGAKVRVKLPTPKVTRTPKGAFAGIQQQDADYYEGQTIHNQGQSFASEAGTRRVPAAEVVFYNDADERSRLVIQLAGVEASTSFYRSCPFPATDRVCAPEAESPEPPEQNTTGGDGGGSLTEDYIDYPGRGTLFFPSSSERSPTLVERIKRFIQRVRDFPAAALSFLIRNPKEALLFAGMWLLFASAPSAIWRRRKLIHCLA